MYIKNLVLLFSFTFASLLGAGHHPKLANHTLAPTLTEEGHFEAGIAALKEEKWKEATQHFRTLFYAYPNSERIHDAHFYTGIGYFHLSEFGTANEALTHYLQGAPNPTFFQEALDYKFAIAEKFRLGERSRLFNMQHLPKVFVGREEAIAIYDEIIATVPSQEMAVRSLYSKALTLWDMNDYQGGVEAFRLLIRRYPMHELAPESYVATMKLYLDQAKNEPHNHDILPFAQINLAKFEQEFPRDERIAELHHDFVSIKEVYAQGLYETGQFYERIAQPKAAFLYYYNAYKQYPETNIATKCRARLEALGDKKVA